MLGETTSTIMVSECVERSPEIHWHVIFFILHHSDRKSSCVHMNSHILLNIWKYSSETGPVWPYQRAFPVGFRGV